MRGTRAGLGRQGPESWHLLKCAPGAPGSMSWAHVASGSPRSSLTSAADSCGTAPTCNMRVGAWKLQNHKGMGIYVFK